MDDSAPDDSILVDILLFVLVLLGVIYAHHKKRQDEEF